MVDVTKDEDGLTPMQARYCIEYVVDLNQRQAAIRAGYSEHSADQIASGLMVLPTVVRRIDVLKAELAERVGLNAEAVVRVITETIHRCRQAYPLYDKSGLPRITETPEGTLAHAYAFDAKGVLKGCELLGKHIGMFIERRQVEFPKGVPITNLTKEEFRELAGAIVGAV